ncbi:OmpA family protein [Rhizobium leguminosarum]|uniref:OmpA family protein n=1 Tax=Rhizobium TaxID=379 RepID=UPI0013C037A0|nr:OmpA family protein [Rhizobium leguminosarum]MBY5375038.1 OmpA family protein [Rhizobium leguminosarum]NEH60917.1 OmpA family protein [Rhizobium leguminosarum]UIK18569.1 OmpA family protein [Rhizobium leguminosarum]
MRGGFRTRYREEEEESAFVSMTDMTVSFLFIVILLLAYFASQYSDKNMVPRPDYERASQERDDARRERDDARRQIMRLQMLVSQREATITELREEIDVKQKEIDDLRHEVEQLKEELEKLRKIDPLETYLALSAVERRRILETLRDQLKVDFPDLEVVISEETDALRFQGDGLFATGSFSIRPDRRAIVESIATRLAQILPCYTVGARSNWRPECNPGNAIIEALQIEGHTDSTGDFTANLALSTNRANSTFSVIVGKSPELVEFLNFRKQPVLSVAGYGQMRPVKDNATKEGRDTNRRVDLRIIMYTPSKSEEIERIKDALTVNTLRKEAN